MRTLKMFMTAFLLAGLAGTANAAPGGMSAAAQGDLAFADQYQKSVALLLSKDFSSDYKMHCTATAIERNGNVYRFVSAAHCVASDDKSREKVKVMGGRSWHLTFDKETHKTVIYNAKIVGVGYQSKGDDFLVLEATIEDREVPVVAFAKNPARVLEPVINVAAPVGLGKQVFIGHVTSNKLDRPVQEGDINWEGAILLNLGSMGGSSGSAIVSLEQRGIIAFLVGGIGGGDSTNTVGLSSQNFWKFYDKIKAGKYKYWRDTEAEEPRDCYYKTNPDGSVDRSQSFCRESANSRSAAPRSAPARARSLPDTAPTGPATLPNVEARPDTGEFRKETKSPLIKRDK